METPSVGFADTFVNPERGPGGPGEAMGVEVVDLLCVHLHGGIMGDED